METKFMTPEQVYANLLNDIEKVKEILKGDPLAGRVGVILMNKERIMTAVITEDGRVSEAFDTLTPQHLPIEDAMRLRNYYKDVHGEPIKMELVCDFTYYKLLLKKMTDTAKAFQNVYGF